MVIKLDKVVSYYKSLPRINPCNPLNTWPSEFTWHIRYVIISTTTKLLTIGPGKIMSFCERFSPIKPHNPINTWSFHITWPIKSSSAIPKAIQVSRVVTNCEEQPAIKSHDNLSKSFIWRIRTSSWKVQKHKYRKEEVACKSSKENKGSF